MQQGLFSRESRIDEEGVPDNGVAQKQQNRIHLLLLFELVLLALWSMAFAQPYLNMDPDVIPAGQEFLTAIQSHHLWTRMTTCGWCAWWNDSVRGGAPSNGDMYGSMLHPLVGVTNIIWGVRNGTKIALAVSFFLGGLAQWWLALVLGLGRPARIWVGLMGVIAGHLVGRIELGTFGLVLSTASCALAIPALIQVSRTASRRDAVILGVVLALAAVSGQGYLQVGLFFTLPALLLLIPFDWKKFRRVAGAYMLAALLAALLAAPFLVPFFHFFSYVDKPFVSELKGQTISHMLLNFVVNDRDYFFEHSNVMNRQVHPWLYINFVGWIPVFLALWTIRGARNVFELRAMRYLLLVMVISLWMASDGPLEALAKRLPEDIQHSFRSMRYFPVIASLAVVPILGLASIGLDKLLQQPLRWKYWQKMDMRWFIAIALLFSLKTTWDFAENWKLMKRLDDDVAPVLQALQTPDLQWVNTPHGQFRFIEPGINTGLKIGNAIRPWSYNKNGDPPPIMWINQEDEPAPPAMTPTDTLSGFVLYVGKPADQYAVVHHDDGDVTICTAQGMGGDIDVACEIDSDSDGYLLVKENSLSDWQAFVDGQPAEIEEARWLRVSLTPGTHTIQFRYRPWDVPVGLGLCALGVVLSLGFFFVPFRHTYHASATPINMAKTPSGTSHGK